MKKFGILGGPHFPLHSMQYVPGPIMSRRYYYIHVVKIDVALSSPRAPMVQTMYLETTQQII